MDFEFHFVTGGGVASLLRKTDQVGSYKLARLAVLPLYTTHPSYAIDLWLYRTMMDLDSDVIA